MMNKGFEDFSLPDGVSGLPIRFLDYDKLLELPDAEFRRRYIEEMQSYFDEWQRNSVECWECSKLIVGAEELFRYYGANLHIQCLEKTHSAERRLNSSSEREYFKRIIFTGKQFELHF